MMHWQVMTRFAFLAWRVADRHLFIIIISTIIAIIIVIIIVITIVVIIIAGYCRYSSRATSWPAVCLRAFGPGWGSESMSFTRGSRRGPAPTILATLGV